MTREYKDSGIEWIGQIPKEWEVKPHKRLMKRIKNLCSEYKGEDILSLTMKGVIVRDLTSGGKMPTSFDGYQYVYPDNLLMCLFDIDVTPRCVGLIKNYGLTSPAYSQFTLFEGAYGAYYNYLLRYIDDEKCILHLSKNLRSSLTEDDFGQIPTIHPPIDEQQHIADYLDKKCAEIDSLIALQEQMIAQLTDYKQSVITEAVTKGLNPNAELVPSGIDWIGNVPKGWKVSIFKKGIKLLTDYTANGSFGDLAKNVKYLDQPDYSRLVRLTDLRENLNNSNGVWISEYSHKYLAKSELFGGELLIANVGAYAGYACLMPEVNFICTLGPNMELIRCNKRLNNKYTCYMLQSKQFFEYIQVVASSTAQPKLNKDNIRNIPVIYPPIDEQISIASYLDEKCDEIDSLIATKQKKIETLREYKKSIIYEAVTGKINVD